VQAVALLAAEKEPAAHCVHVCAPAAEKVPGQHVEQAPALAAE